MTDAEEFEQRPDADVRREQDYLSRRILQIERGMGTIAAREPHPTPASNELAALERARSLARELSRQAQIRGLEEAIAARLDWLERAAARQAATPYEPVTDLDMIPLDRRILADLLAGWRKAR